MFKLFCACKKNVVYANVHRGSQMPLYKSILTSYGGNAFNE